MRLLPLPGMDVEEGAAGIRRLTSDWALQGGHLRIDFGVEEVRDDRNLLREQLFDLRQLTHPLLGRERSAVSLVQAIVGGAIPPATVFAAPAVVRARNLVAGIGKDLIAAAPNLESGQRGPLLGIRDLR